MITKLYLVLFSTFWLLFISSFIGTKIDTADEAKIIYSNVMVVSVVLGVACAYWVGKAIDCINPQVMIPIGFYLRLLSIILFMFIQDPNSIYSYGVSVLLVIGSLFEGMCSETLLLRLAKP